MYYRKKNIIRRADHLSHILSGVEVDILSSDGILSVYDDALSELDYVTCSFHPDFWFIVGNGEINKKSQMIDTYMAAVDNKNIDTLSHPTINIPPEIRSQMSVGDWEELFRFMQERGVAFEVNLDSTNLIYNDGENLDRSLVLGAIKYGVPIVIGFDFHYPHDWGASLSPRLVDSKNIEPLFKQYLRDGTLDKLLARVIGNIYVLKQMGLKPCDIVNHSPESFNKWLSPRKVSY